MGEAETFDFSFDVIANVPGIYTGKASVAHLYYTREQQFYSPPFQITITPRQQRVVPKAENETTTPPEDSTSSLADTMSDAVSDPEDSDSATPELSYYSGGQSINEFYGGFDLSSYGSSSYGGFVGF